MSHFIDHGPLPPGSPLFTGHHSQLTRLERMCQGDVRTYGIVYGGRRTGKTTLMLQLEQRLPLDVTCCRVDFQSLPDADDRRMYGWLAEQISLSLRLASPSNLPHDVSTFVGYLRQAVRMSPGEKVVILLEELGTLTEETRYNLANLIRSIFTNRATAAYQPLKNLVFIISGSIEVFNLAVPKVSTLHSVCEEIYLPDFRQPDALALVENGLAASGLQHPAAAGMAQAIYDLASGHPYLTQTLGRQVEDALLDGEKPGPKLVEELARQALGTDSFFRQMVSGIELNNLQTACRELLTRKIAFNRNIEVEMARLELLGVAHDEDGKWAPRNALITRTLESLLGRDKRRRSGAQPPAPAADGKYNITIQHAGQVSIGEPEDEPSETDAA